MAQLSSSVANRGPVQAGTPGVNFAFASFASGGSKTPFSGSVSDSIVMMKLPRNAQIIAAYLGGMCQDGNMGFSLGDPASNTQHGTKSISATSLGTGWFEGVKAGSVFSVSDDQNTYALTLHLQNVTSLSGSMSVHLGVLWIKR